MATAGPTAPNAVTISLPEGYCVPKELAARRGDVEFVSRVLDFGTVTALAVEKESRSSGLDAGDTERIAVAVKGLLLPELQAARAGVEHARAMTAGLAGDVAGVVRAFGGSAAKGTIGSAGERGQAGEEVLAERFRAIFPRAELEEVAREARRADFRLHLPGESRRVAGAPPATAPATILIESKNVKRITRGDVEKFRRDLATSSAEGVAAGVFASLQPGTIPHRGTFAIEAGPADPLPAVYLGNVLADLGGEGGGQALRMAVRLAAYLGEAWRKSAGALSAAPLSAAPPSDSPAPDPDLAASNIEVRRQARAVAQLASEGFESQAASLRSARQKLAQLTELVGKMETSLGERSAALVALLES
ncbi:MAG TPA: hypothetical protein QGF05_14435 [Dehalococcoidia bacterium]|nr:hypothetical protein [Dehalococcoidia bacterium]